MVHFSYDMYGCLRFLSVNDEHAFLIMRNEKSFYLLLRNDNMTDAMCCAVGAISTITNHHLSY